MACNLRLCLEEVHCAACACALQDVSGFCSRQEPVPERKADLNDVRKKAASFPRRADLLSASPADRTQDAPKEDDHHGLRELGRAQEIQQRLVEADLWAGRWGERLQDPVKQGSGKSTEAPLCWHSTSLQQQPGCLWRLDQQHSACCHTPITASGNFMVYISLCRSGTLLEVAACGCTCAQDA